MSLYFRDYSFGIENNQFHAQNMVPVQNRGEVVVHNGKNLRGKKKKKVMPQQIQDVVAKHLIKQAY